MQLLVGLGNPGEKYAKNRHNIGFMAIDAIAAAHRFSPWQKKFRGLFAEGGIQGEKIYALKPQTFMNLSGESVAETARFYKIPTENILVLHDELDFDFGTVKLKRAGGSGGHNGLRSIEAHLGAEFLRLRFGIGKGPGEGADHVLSDFSKAEMKDIEKMLEKLSETLFPAIKNFHAIGANQSKLELLEKPVSSRDTLVTRNS